MQSEKFNTKRESLIAALKSFDADCPHLSRATKLILSTLANGGTIYTCGNGGSAAEALHLTEELVGRYKRDRSPLRSVCLNADATLLSCIANDFGYDAVFARQVDCFCKDDDLLIALTTSGNSKNVRLALDAAKKAAVNTIVLGGSTDAFNYLEANATITFNTLDSATIQEMHLFMIHYFLEHVEKCQK